MIMNNFIKYFASTIVLLSLLVFNACTEDVKQEEIKDFVIKSRVQAEPDNLNPVLTIKGYSIHVFEKIFPALINYDPKTNALSPELAKSRPIITPITEGPFEGGATFEYEIREEAVWDNGQPVTANDYLFTMKAIFNQHVAAPAYRGLLDFIKKIEIDETSPKKFTVTTNRLFRAEAGTGIYVYPEHVYDPAGLMKTFEFEDLIDEEKYKSLDEGSTKLKEFGEQFNSNKYKREVVESCGAYKLLEWETGQKIVLERKENWWGDKVKGDFPLLTAAPKQIIYKVIPDNVAAIAALKSGDLDVVGKLPAAAFNEFQASELADQFHFAKPKMNAYMYVGLNNRNPKLSDKKVRRAIAHLTDVDEIIKTIQLGLAVPTTSPYPPNASYFDKSLSRITLDVDKAKSLLTEAGWTDSDGNGIVDKNINGKKEELSIAIMCSSNSKIGPQIVALMTENAKKAGVEIKLDAKPARELYAALGKREFDGWTAASGFDLDLYDPHQSWHTENDAPGGPNRVGFGNKETDTLIENIRNAKTESERVASYQKLQAIIYDEQPCIFLYRPLNKVVASKKIKNFHTSLRHPGYFENTFQY